MFERIKIAEYIYECVVERSHKTLLGQMTTILVSAGKQEDKKPHQLLTKI